MSEDLWDVVKNEELVPAKGDPGMKGKRNKVLNLLNKHCFNLLEWAFKSFIGIYNPKDLKEFGLRYSILCKGFKKLKFALLC